MNSNFRTPSSKASGNKRSKGGHFVMVHRRVLYELRDNPRAIQVYLYLRDRGSNEQDLAWPVYSTIAKHCGITVRTAQTIVKLLAARRLILIRKRHYHDGRVQNEYPIVDVTTLFRTEELQATWEQLDSHKFTGVEHEASCVQPAKSISGIHRQPESPTEMKATSTKEDPSLEEVPIEEERVPEGQQRAKIEEVHRHYISEMRNWNYEPIGSSEGRTKKYWRTLLNKAGDLERAKKVVSFVVKVWPGMQARFPREHFGPAPSPSFFSSSFIDGLIPDVFRSKSQDRGDLYDIYEFREKSNIERERTKELFN